MVTDARAEKAMCFLAETDRSAAAAKVESLRLEEEIKAIEAAIFTRVEGSVEQRKAMAKMHENTVEARKSYFDALLRSEHLINKRRTETLLIDVWRTEAANRRMGQTSQGHA